MENGLTASDVALMSKDNNDAWGSGGAFMWIFALLILAGGGGFGGYGNNANAATGADIQRAVDLNSIQSGQANIASDVQRTTYETMGVVKDASYNNLSEIRDLQASIASGFANQQTCCCETKQAIMENRYLDAQNASNIMANTTAQTQKIMDALSANRMADMQNQINALQLQLATASTVKYPTSTTYTMGANPYCGMNSLAVV